MAVPSPTRRALLSSALIGGGTLLLPACGPARAAPSDPDPHFFVLIVLNGGADASYMFDARPLSMTAAGRIQNYVGQEPTPCVGRNGTTSLASRLVAPLAALRDRFSVLNGVYMTPSFDGHLQNLNYFLTGNAFGGDAFMPLLNAADTGREPYLLDAIVPANPLFGNITNAARVVPLQPKSVAALAAGLRQIQPLEAGHELADFIRARLIANASGPGRFSAASSAMLAGLDGSADMHRRLAQLQPPQPDGTPEQQSMSLIAQSFRLGIARSAVHVLPESFDVHAPELARAQPRLFGDAIRRIAGLITGLMETPFDARRSLFDLTTVMVASEFSRTLRAADMPVQQTGTHHNQYANTILIGGRGIRGGMVIGASDVTNEHAEVSKAHLSLDPTIVRAMGLPFDFATMKPRSDRPEGFDIADYLTVNSVMNTLYALFGVPDRHWRSARRDLPAAPVLRGLLG